jgi:hypothetical protein
MHITGREKMLLTQPAREVLVVAVAVSDGEWEVSGTDVLSCRAVPGLVYPLARVVRRFSAAFAAPKRPAELL